jgi:hypothetical protein
VTSTAAADPVDADPDPSHTFRRRGSDPPMKSALTMHVQVGDDHVVKLPDEVPVGPAEIIVLIEETTATGVLDDFEPIEPVRPVRLSDLVIEGRG